MKNFYFENQGSNTFLVYEALPDETIDTMSLGMITNNNIHGIAKTMFMQIDNKKFIKYNVSSKVSVAQLFSGVVNKKRLLAVFSGIVNALLDAEEYMLDTNSFVLDLNYIFVDVSTCETAMVCLPLTSDQQPHLDMGSFFRNIIYTTQFDQTENCDHVARIINFFNSSPMFSLYEFKKLMEELSRQNSTQSANVYNCVSQSQYASVNDVSGASVPQNAEVKKVVKPQPQPQPKPQPQPHPTPSSQSASESFSGSATPARSGNDFGFAVPGSDAKKENNQNEASSATQEDSISLGYLLQHFNKDNLAAFKAQRASKKKPQNDNTPVQPKTTTPKAEKSNDFGFAIPGQQSPIISQPAAQPKKETSTPAAPSAPIQASSIPTPPSAAPTTPKAGPSVAPVFSGLSNDNFGDTVLVGNDFGDNTVLLDGNTDTSPSVRPHLVRAKNNEIIMINKQVFKIGKDSSYVDYCISDNSTISRSHAIINTRNDEYYILDTNSTNHTYVNNVMIQSNTEVKLNHGDNVRFSNEDFDFKMY